MDGILVVYKPKGMTSRDVVNKVGRILKIKKIGHTGTLDPLATGVLVLCIGKATKIVELLTATEKEYIAEMSFGIETDTLDSTGNIIKEEDFIVDEEKIEKVFSSLTGTYKQEVPLYSAIHVNGKKLYEYARNNEEVILPSRDVTISHLELLSIEENKVLFKTRVSKGPYIRSLIRDIAKKLDTVAVMSKLERIKQGNFTLDSSFTLEQIENNNFSLLSIAEALKEYPSIIVSNELEEKIKNGNLLYNDYERDNILFLNQNNIPLALYHIYEKDRSYLKPWKMFL